MAKQENIREMKYTSPSGLVFTLLYDDVERSGSKKLSIHDLPQQDKAIVQDLGNSPTAFQITCYLTGNESDNIGDSFFNSLYESGPGLLQHPRWGDIEVIPITYSQSESMVNSLKRVNFSIQFFPTSIKDFEVTSLKITESLPEVIVKNNELAIITFTKNFINSIDKTSSNVLLSIKKYCSNFAEEFAKKARPFLAADPELAAQFEKGLVDFNGDLNSIFTNPESFINNYHNFLRIPFAMPVSVYNRAVFYYNSVLNAIDTIEATYNGFIAFIGTLLNLSLGISESTSTEDPENRPEAISTESVVDEIQTLFNNYVSIASNDYDYVFPFESLDNTNKSLLSAKKILTDNLFNLESEKRITLNTAKSPYILCWENYKDINKIDKFISDNKLKGNEILMVPSGREVVFYV